MPRVTRGELDRDARRGLRRADAEFLTLRRAQRERAAAINVSLIDTTRTLRRKIFLCDDKNFANWFASRAGEFDK